MLSYFERWVLSAPLWSIGLVTFAGMLACSLLATELRRRQDRQSALAKSELSTDTDEGLMVSAVIGLLALLVAFTFSIAINRFESRRANVVSEANAIGTTFLRAQLLEEPHRTEISRLLIQYTDTRLALATHGPGSEQERLLGTSDQLIGQLWTATVSAFPSMRSYPFSSTFIEGMNGLIDMDTVRKAGRQAHVTAAVFLALILYQFVAAGVVSYSVAGSGGRRSALVLFLLLSILIILIIDVDRPTKGAVTEAQEPMLQLREFLQAHPPRSFSPLNVPAEASR